MRGKIRNGFGLSEAGDVRRRGAQDAMNRRELSRDQRGIGQNPRTRRYSVERSCSNSQPPPVARRCRPDTANYRRAAMLLGCRGLSEELLEHVHPLG